MAFSSDPCNDAGIDKSWIRAKERSFGILPSVYQILRVARQVAFQDLPLLGIKAEAPLSLRPPQSLSSILHLALTSVLPLRITYILNSAVCTWNSFVLR